MLPPRMLLIGAALPLLVDGLAIGFLVYDVTNVTRAATGALFGIVVPFTIIPAAQEAARELFGPTHPISHTKGLSDA